MLNFKQRQRISLRLLRSAYHIARGRKVRKLLRNSQVVIPVGDVLSSKSLPELVADDIGPAHHSTSPHKLWRMSPIEAGRPVCLFVTYTADGMIWPHVLHYMQKIRDHGIYTFLIAATERDDLAVNDPGASHADALLAKKNGGFDFACWALALTNHPEIWNANGIFLANDSVYGPFQSFGGVMSRVLNDGADFTGLTECFEIKPHYQSYFIVMKNRALQNAQLRRFWRDIQLLQNKTQVIHSYEVGLTQCAKAAGLTTHVLFPSPPGIDPGLSNLVLHDWRGLIERGFPFVKVSVLRHARAQGTFAGWRRLLRDNGYNDNLAAFHLGAVNPSSAALAA